MRGGGRPASRGEHQIPLKRASEARGLAALDSSTPIVVFGLIRGTFDHASIGITRSGGRLGVAVHRVSRERWAPSAVSRYNRGWVTIPHDASDERILASLQELTADIGRAVLVPIDDVASVFVDTHADALSQDFLFPRQPTGLAHRLSSKREMHELCKRHEIPTPAAHFPSSERNLTALADELGFPIAVKCIDTGDTAASAPKVVIANNSDELLHAYRLMESPRGSNVMLQEYIPGSSESVWMFNGYFDEQSQCRVAFTGKKIRQAPPYRGVTTLGVCEANAAVEQATTRLMKAVGYRGILDIGFRFDQRDGQYKLLDVNPRIGGSFRLFVGDDGTDVLRALYRDMTGQQIPHTKAQQGRRWIVEPLDLSSSLVHWRRGDLTLRGWSRSLRGVREAAWFAVDDPLPCLALWLGMLFVWLPRRALGRW